VAEPGFFKNSLTIAALKADGTTPEVRKEFYGFEAK